MLGSHVGTCIFYFQKRCSSSSVNCTRLRSVLPRCPSAVQAAVAVKAVLTQGARSETFRVLLTKRNSLTPWSPQKGVGIAAPLLKTRARLETRPGDRSPQSGQAAGSAERKAPPLGKGWGTLSCRRKQGPLGCRGTPAEGLWGKESGSEGLISEPAVSSSAVSPDAVSFREALPQCPSEELGLELGDLPSGPQGAPQGSFPGVPPEPQSRPQPHCPSLEKQAGTHSRLGRVPTTATSSSTEVTPISLSRSPR